MFKLFSLGFFIAETNDEKLEKETLEVERRSQQIAKIYEIPPGCDLFDITERVLTSDLLTEESKRSIRNKKRKIFLFSYLSDGLKIKGFITFVPNPETHSTLIFLRGGCKNYGIPMPGFGLSDLGNFTIISTTNRDGVSEGCDEYGGNDINDVKNLIDYIPTLEAKLAQTFSNHHLFMLGSSRGAMQLFLSLARYPEIQNKIAKAIALSGLLDMETLLVERQDIRKMFIEEFGLIEGQNEAEWIAKRNPILTVPYIKKDLPILIAQGTGDLRTSPHQSRKMVATLQKQGCNVEYWEIEDGNHNLINMPDRDRKLIDWLEKK